MILLLLALGGCVRSEKDGPSPESTDTRAVDSEDSGDSGDSHADDSGDSAETGDSGGGETGDSGATDPPPFPCPDPPKGAVVLDARGYFGDAVVYNFAGGWHGWWLALDLMSSEVAQCYDGRVFYPPAVEGGYGVDIDITAPLGAPSDAVGAYTFDWSNVNSPLRLGFFASVWQGERKKTGATFWSMVPSVDHPATGALCLSRVTPERVEGTLTVLSDPEHEDPRDFYVRFRFDTEDPSNTSEYDDGTCFHWGYFGVSAEDAWDPAYWKAHPPSPRGRSSGPPWSGPAHPHRPM